MPVYKYPSKNSTNFFIYFMIAGLSFILGWQLTSFGIFGSNNADTEAPIAKQEQEVSEEIEMEKEIDMQLFWTVWEEIETKYVDLDAIDKEKMVYGAIKGMVSSLEDPYTVFMTPTEAEEFEISLEGNLEGIGAELTVRDGALVIATPLKGSPAEEAGLLTGDIIFEVDGESTADMSLLDAVMKIRGEKGTAVELTIIREGEDEPFTVGIVRDSINIESVTSEDLENGIKYISINQFNEKTSGEFSDAMNEVLLADPKGIILDLRNNGGGYLDVAVEVLSYFLETDLPTVIVKQRGEKDQSLPTIDKPKVLDIPVVVLMNGSSASASEIVAGALQDHERGIVMGENSFGKGSVQEVEYFSDSSLMRITVAKWFTPNDRTIDEVGLTPDIVVEQIFEEGEDGLPLPSDQDFDEQKAAAVDYLLEL